MGKITLREFSEQLQKELIKDISFDSAREELVVTMHQGVNTSKRIKLNYVHLANVVTDKDTERAVTPKAVFEYISELLGKKIATLDDTEKLEQSQIPNMDCGIY